jgi:TonB family protein
MISAQHAIRRFATALVRRAAWPLVLAVSCGLAPAGQAQQAEGTRKLMYRVEPRYPEDLKRHDIGGAVRLSIEITPRGTVRKISPIGGNPILVDAAIIAVKQWKYVPAETTDTLEVKVDFIPRQ